MTGEDAFIASLKNGDGHGTLPQNAGRDPVITPVDDSAGAGPGPGAICQKGGWVLLHMLRQQVTTPIFFKAIKTY